VASEPEEFDTSRRAALNLSSINHTFATFKRIPGTEKALKAFQDLALGKTEKPLLLCYGGVGNGKTHLCEALVIELNRRGIFTRYYTFGEIIRTLRRTMRDDSRISPSDLLERYCQARTLVVDDVGMGGSGSEWEFGQLEEIVSERYRFHLLTVMTTNRDIKELPERVVSRFSDPAVATLVLNSGKDFRKNRA
jgi:DNA replication protein DnaC